jgi:two-component sensor histidine kinase
VRLQSRSIQDAEAKLVIKDSQERLEAIAILHQQFYQNEDINQVDFSRFLENLMKNKLFLQNLDGKEIKYLISTDSNSVSIENSLPIALIINELVTNSIKHAFKESNVIQPQINITIKDKTMVYTDNGVSRSATINEKSMKSFGSQLISDLCLQLDGNYQMDRSDGFRFELKF